MTTIFTDINIAIRHLILHNGLDSVTREGKKCDFNDYYDIHILLALLTEIGITEEAHTFFDHFSLKKGVKSYQTRNYLYATGTFKASHSIEIGDLFCATETNAEGQEVTGVVLEKNEDGLISKYIAFEKKSYYSKSLVIVQNQIEALAIKEAFSLKLPIEPLTKDSSAIAFYGQHYETMLARRGEGKYDYQHIIGSTVYKVNVYLMDGFFKYLSFGAPTWIIERFQMLDKIEQAARICAGLGMGVQLFTPESKMKPGTVLFTKEGAISMMLIDFDCAGGRAIPSLVPNISAAGYNINWIKQETITHFWEPSIEAYQYVPSNENPAFKEVNRLIGALYCIYGCAYKNVAYNYSIFDFSMIRDPECWHPEVYQLLHNAKSNQDSSYWMTYLADKGAGLIDGSNTPQAGDFLFFEIKKIICSGIAIDSENMIYQDNWTGKCEKVKIENLKKIWRPALKA